MQLSEHVVHDYKTLSLSLKAHPVSFLRQKLRALNILSSEELKTKKDGDAVKVAGLVLVRQRPGTASGICFMTIEDETGDANLVVFPKLFDHYRKEILNARLIMVEGKLQVDGIVVHVIVDKCYDLTKLLRKLTPVENEQPLLLQLSSSDAEQSPPLADSKENSELVFPGGRNFK
jgi:error-prone DNA polymerase